MRVLVDTNVLLRALDPRWRALIMQYGVSGAKVHDAYLAAALLVQGADLLLTFDKGDFARYVGIQVADPRDIVPAGTL